MNRKPPGSSPPPFPPRPPLGKLLSLKEAAEYLNVQPKFFTRYRERSIPHVHVGPRFLKWPQGWLDAWLQGWAFSCPKPGCTPTASEESAA